MERNRLRAFQNDREQANHDRIERLLEAVVKRERDDTFGYGDALMELEEARLMALSTFPPQVSAAVQATRCKAELMGLIIRKSQDIPHRDRPFNGAATEEQEEAVYERLAERIGSAGAARFRKLIDTMRKSYEGPIIDGEAEEIEE